MNPQLNIALAQAVRVSKGPGAVAFVGTRDGVAFHEASGFAQTIGGRRQATRDTIYDLASLTKVVATTTAVLKLYESGVIDLDQPANEWVPIPAFSRFTIRQLLTHTSGLTAGKPLYKEHKSIDSMLQAYAAMPLVDDPGTRYRYSDAGYKLLGKIVELAARDSLDAFCRRAIFDPLGMKDTCFRPPKELWPRIAATEQCAWRGRVVQGEVHDENAYAAGGVAGHAGLFSTAADLGRFVRGLFEDRILSAATFNAMTQRGQVPFWPWQGLGWQLDPWSSEVYGFLPARTAFGHTGWTGTCMWSDRESGVYAILLGNTCHPSRSRRDNAEFRRTFYTAVAEHVLPKQTNCQTGLDRVVRDRFEGLTGKRVALLTNHAATDSLGRHILDVLKLEPGVKLTLLYSPEHGFHGQAEAGAKVASEQGRVPVISLYGDRKAPTAEELAQVDVFVVDLQDVGARYYTYAATMKACIGACAAAGKDVMVLDRPNPVGGAVLEGPIASDGGSLVRYAQVPIRHGMTMGELAIYFKQTEFRSNQFSLLVKSLENWTPERLFDECQLPWTPPSPNLPTAETALMYVGTCLFEGTNLNEGRGTETPFLVFGAPWLNSSAVIGAIAKPDREGVALEPTLYTPRSMPGKAASPRFQDQTCQGIRIQIVDRRAARPFHLVVALLRAIREQHADRFEWIDFFDTLAGTDSLRLSIERGMPTTDIIRGYDAALTAFDQLRPKRYHSTS